MYLILDDALAFGFHQEAQNACGVRAAFTCSCAARNVVCGCGLMVEDVPLSWHGSLFLFSCLVHLGYGVYGTQSVSTMHLRNSSQAPDFVWLAYQRGNYSKVLDISAFRKKMRLSHQLALCQSHMGHLIFLSARNYAEAQTALNSLVLTGDYPSANLGT